MEGMKRFLVAVMLVACGGNSEPAKTPANPEPLPTPAPIASTSPATSTAPPQDEVPAFNPEPDWDGRIAKARKLRDAFMALKAPKLAKAASKEEAMKFIQTKVKAWYEEAKPKADEAEKAYVEANKSARTPSEKAATLGEVADIHTTFVERFIESGNSGIPAEWKKDPELTQTFDGAMRQATAPSVAHAREIVKRCATASPNDAKCLEVDKRVTALEKAAKP